VEQHLPHSRVGEDLQPTLRKSADLQAGVLVQLHRAGVSAQRWVGWGSTASMRLGKERVRIAFGDEVQPLGFSVKLDDFEVERNEGTETPAGFKSHVRFIDSRGVTLARDVWMNHPATFPEVTGASFLGTAYKFSQASWNPNDLRQTTLQVVRDPGWSLKWIGSVLVCVGLFAMFYLQPNGRRVVLNDL
jgi:hypothetical protein